MEKKSIFNKVILFLCFITLIVNTIEINQIRLQTKLSSSKTLIQKIKYNFPVELKLNQKIINENNAELIIKDKNFAEKINAPISQVKFGYFGEQYSTTNSYSVSDESNRFVYVNANVKNFYKKKLNLDSLISAKMIYDNKYEFDCSSIKLTKDKTDFSDTISFMPLQSEDVYFITEMPKNFVNTKKPIDLELTIDDTKYVMKLR